MQTQASGTTSEENNISKDADKQLDLTFEVESIESGVDNSASDDLQEIVCDNFFANAQEDRFHLKTEALSKFSKNKSISYLTEATGNSHQSNDTINSFAEHGKNYKTMISSDKLYLKTEFNNVLNTKDQTRSLALKNELDTNYDGSNHTSRNNKKQSTHNKPSNIVFKNSARLTTQKSDNSDAKEKSNNCNDEATADELKTEDFSKNLPAYVQNYINNNTRHTQIANVTRNMEERTNEFDSKHETENDKYAENINKNMPEFMPNDIVHKFAGLAFCSFRERPAHKRGWRRQSLPLVVDQQLKPEAELSRSQYSLVSCNDLTAGAVQLWMGLPEEVKFDPALAPFRQFYEKEHGKLLEDKRNASATKKRLPSVNSAPHLNNNHHIVRDDPFSNVEKQTEKSEKMLEVHDSSPKRSLLQQAQHYTKMSMLLACWIFFTAAFLMYNEKETVTRNTSVAPYEVKSYPITSMSPSFSILLQLSGPFLSDNAELKLNGSDAAAAKKMEVWVERLQSKGDEIIQTSDVWRLTLQDEASLDFSEGEPRSHTLKLKPYAVGANVTSNILMRIRTTANTTTPFAMSYTLDPLDLHTGVIYASVLLFGLYVLIIFEIINRTMAAILVATTALATLAIVGERPTLPEIISWLDMETLLLLFSMMLLVAIMAETGMFDFLAVFTFEVTKGKLWPLISLLCAITAILSTFLDNVTTVLLMTPVTIRLCEVMDLDPIPVLMSMVLFSNIGGTATPVGDPPNVIIASNKAVVQAGINFTNFTLHMTMGILLVCVQTYIQLRFIYRDTNKLRLNEPRDIKDLRHQISIWRRAAESLPHMSRDEHVVRERLERKVKKLTIQLDAMVKESSKRAIPKDTFRSTLAEMKEKYKIRDKMLLVKSTVAIGFVVTVFFLHSIPELNRVSLGWTALLGAILLITLADREDLEPILHRVEWSTLLFFAALFVLMEALSKLGLIEFIGGLTESVILSVDESARLAVAILLMLWVSGITSAFVDNIPLTTMMVRVVTSLGSNPNLNLPMTPLIWALSFGACLGGNGTLIGASANVVCAGVAEQHGYKFSFMQFFKVGFPMMIGHLIVASGYLMFCHCLFAWH